MTDSGTIAPSETANRSVLNRILSNMAADDFEALKPYLKLVELKRNAIIQEANAPLKYVHFIESGFLSRVARTQSDGLVEVAIVGRLGFVGIGFALGTMKSIHRTIVVMPGRALRIDVNDLQRVIQERPAIREQLLCYVQMLIMQKSQTILCNVRHELDQRLARWMLLAQEVIQDGRLPVTQDMLAMMLGVRREQVCIALAKLEADRVIRKSRGTIDVIDCEALEQRACECFRIVQQNYRRLFPTTSSSHEIACEAHAHTIIGW